MGCNFLRVNRQSISGAATHLVLKSRWCHCFHCQDALGSTGRRDHCLGHCLVALLARNQQRHVKLANQTWHVPGAAIIMEGHMDFLLQVAEKYHSTSTRLSVKIGSNELKFQLAVDCGGTSVGPAVGAGSKIRKKR